MGSVVPTNLDDLKQLVTRTLGPAKENLIEYGQALPMVLLFSHDGRRRTIPAPDKFQVGKIIKNEKPDSFVYISEVWIRDDITPEEEQLKKTREGWKKYRDACRRDVCLLPANLRIDERLSCWLEEQGR